MIASFVAERGWTWAQVCGHTVAQLVEQRAQQRRAAGEADAKADAAEARRWAKKVERENEAARLRSIGLG